MVHLRTTNIVRFKSMVTRDPEKCLNSWMSCLRPGGLCIIEHSSRHEAQAANELDPFGQGHDCGRRSGKMSIRLDGSVPLCCVTYDRRITATENFLETPHDEIQLQRYSHDFCGDCMRHGMHVAPVGIRQRLAQKAIGKSRLAGLARWILGAKERQSGDRIEDTSDTQLPIRRAA